MTLYVYPEHRCGYTTVAVRPDDQQLCHVSCTNPEDSPGCAQGTHYDKFVQLRFRVPRKLKSSDDGHTSRA